MMKAMKGLYALLFFFFLLPFTYSLEECKGTTNIDEIPCLVLLNFNVSNLNCGDYSVSFYTLNETIYTETMGNYSPFFCNSTFNQTTLGTYNFQFSTGDTGTIIVEAGNKMELLLYFAAAITIILFIAGLSLRDNTFIAISGYIALVLGLWVFINGFSVYDNMVTNMVAVSLIGIGGYIIVRSTFPDIKETFLGG